MKKNQSWKVTGQLPGQDKVSEAPYRFATAEEARNYASMAESLGVEGIKITCVECDQPVNASFSRTATEV